MSLRHAAVTLFIAVASLCVTPCSAGEKRAEPPQSRQLREARQCLDLEVFDARKDLKALESLAKKKGPYAPWAAALIARFNRDVHKNPVAGLEIVAAFLLTKEQVKAWKQACKENAEKAYEKYKQDVKEAKKNKTTLPEKPDNELFAPLPAPATWNIKAERMRCAVEAGYCFLALGRMLDAMAVFKAVGEANKENLAEALGTEGGGDLHMQPGKYAKAVGFFEHAVKVCKKIRSYLKDDPYGEVAYHEKRIAKKLGQAKRMRDIEAYGEGFVCYREAEEQRRGRKDYGAALLKYLLVEEKFPGTVYSEASNAYRVKCLLALSTPEETKKREKLIRETQAKLKSRQEELKQLKKDKASRLQIRMFENEVAYYEKELAELKTVPIGAFALKSAEQVAKAFLKKREFGCYRGEVLVDLACYKLERELDLKAAESWLNRASAWLDQVGKVDADLAAYAVPPKAQRVAAMPKQEKSCNAWGTAKVNEPSIGAVANRSNCPWYLSQLLRELRVRCGFVHFMNGRKREAKRDFAAILELDNTVQDLQRRNWPNAHKRLIEDCERGYFWGWPEDLKAFRNRRKIAAFLAGFYFEINELAKAEAIYDRLLAGELGELKREERAFVLQGKGECHYRTFDFNGAQGLFREVATRYAGTPTEPKALLSFASTALNVPKEKGKAAGYFRVVYEKFPDTEWGEKGLYYCGFVQAIPKKPEGKAVLHEFLKKFPKSILCEAARELLARYESVKKEKP